MHHMNKSGLSLQVVLLLILLALLQVMAEQEAYRSPRVRCNKHKCEPLGVVYDNSPVPGCQSDANFKGDKYIRRLNNVKSPCECAVACMKAADTTIGKPICNVWYARTHIV